MTRFIAFLCFITCLFSCSENNVPNSTKDKEISNASFFYVYDTVPRIYQYREVVNGMFEQFHRVYGVRRGDGNHILVEHFTQDGRLTETYDYLVDSMLVYDHLVVGVKGDISATSLVKNKMFPLDDQEVQFKSIFPGLSEGFVLEYERIRKLDKFENRNILSKKLECLKLNERIRVSNINVDSKLQNESVNDIVVYFGKFIGLVEWHDKNFKQHYVLEDIMSQDEWLKIIAGYFGVKPKKQILTPALASFLGLFIPVLKEVKEMMYQYNRDYIFDSTKFEQRFNYQPTAYEDGIKTMLETDYPKE